ILHGVCGVFDPCRLRPHHRWNAWRSWGLLERCSNGLLRLAGFVIAFVASTSETTPSSYVFARLSRLWSVVIPALALTVIFDYAGSRWNPRIYDGVWFATDHPL